MERYPSPKLTAEMHFPTLKTALKIEEKMRKHKKLPISWKRLEIPYNPQIPFIDATFKCSTWNDYWF